MPKLTASSRKSMKKQAHKATRTVAKKTAKKATKAKLQPRVSAPTAVPVLARKSTNRTSLRPVGVGEPPDDTICVETLDAVILSLRSKGRARPGDRCVYPVGRLLKDAYEMAQGREDLPLFEQKRTPITKRHFDWLDLLSQETEKVRDDNANLVAGDKEIVDESLGVATRRVTDDRTALARRAEACGVPLTYFKLNDGYTDPHALFHAASKAAGNARLRISQFNDTDYALTLIEALETSLDALDALLKARDKVTVVGDVTTATSVARRHALKRLLYDAMLYLGPWGRDVTAGDPTKRGRYELDNLFPAKSSTGPAAAPTDALDEPTP